MHAIISKFTLALISELQFAKKERKHAIIVVVSFIILNTIATYLTAIYITNPIVSIVLNWVFITINYLASIESFFEKDLQDGTFDYTRLIFRNQIIIYLIVKTIVHWLYYGLPLTLTLIPMSLLTNLSIFVTLLNIIAIMSITISMSILVTVMYYMLGKMKHKMTLITIVILPLVIPTMLISITYVAEIITNSWNNTTSVLYVLTICKFNLSFALLIGIFVSIAVKMFVLF